MWKQSDFEAKSGFHQKHFTLCQTHINNPTNGRRLHAFSELRSSRLSRFLCSSEDRQALFEDMKQRADTNAPD
jgi:hypothetical protein